ncbi:MAG: heparinase II/III family protein [Alphaproteobacteria bacterium]|nr:heparinase II/III family protein [Alphaproteobacteria bacterium]
MARISLAEYRRVLGYFFTCLCRFLRFRLFIFLLPLRRFMKSRITGLLLVPKDIRTADPTVGNDICNGHFCLDGWVCVTMGEENSVFTSVPPSVPWRNALLGFGWLRHLCAIDSPASRSRARGLIDAWFTSEGYRGLRSYEPLITARRIISWLSHSRLILEDAEESYHHHFLGILDLQVYFLIRTLPCVPHDHARLTCLIALNYAVLCVSGYEKSQPRFAHLLDQELSRQILPDGGHVSRNPGVIVDLLLDLLPLRQTFTSRNISPPALLLCAIDRMIPMIRFFRHGDGSFGLFNGMGVSRFDDMATVLAYDDTFGTSPDNARYSGYQRAGLGKSILLMDTGVSPPIDSSRRAHAGCLSFELSTGRQRLILNCGNSTGVGLKWQEAVRMTAAHSALTVNDSSSSSFLNYRCLQAMTGPVILSGPETVTVRRSDMPHQIVLDATHDGYRKRFGIICKRRLLLRSEGTELLGEDSFEDVDRKKAEIFCAIRFHFHPDIEVSLVQDKKAVQLCLPGSEVWAMAIGEGEVMIEESVYLSGVNDFCRTKQAVIYIRSSGSMRIPWVIQRISQSGEMDQKKVAPE